ncbi:MAG TPA: hypothetical protein VFM70_12530 [Salinimicrobium sp.]|nr:hypothetical protein [Salinimicrobium sp.]
MKKLVIMLIIGCISTGYAQIEKHDSSTESRNTLEYERENESKDVDVRTYVQNDRNFTFRSDEFGYIIMGETKDGAQTTIGKLRKAPNNENFYVLFYEGRNNPSYGRFDPDGNFHSYTYDPIKDEVLEDNYTISPMKSNRSRNPQ